MTSGVIGINAEQKLVSDNIVDQTDRCLRTFKEMIEEMGGTLDDYVKVGIYLTDLNNFKAVNEVYSKYFTKNYPSRTCMQVVRLPLDSLIEMEATACLKKKNN
mmetsp:Transcript_9016/g.9363  ORF Transcript_9016/g.9363 Transcript_9016/m.9363 type:complete len:103 (+) Transcript_9016:1-309(+)